MKRDELTLIVFVFLGIGMGLGWALRGLAT
jgi:hypothetical protein